MKPRTLGGRLVAAFVVLAVAVLLAVGGTLFVVLRGLHADATLGSLGDLADSVTVQVRQSIAAGNLRGTIEELRDALAARSIDVMVVGVDGRLRPLVGEPVGEPIPIADLAPGGQVRGRIVVDDRTYLYVASVVRRAARPETAPRALAFVTLDRSGAQALADLGRAIPAAGLAILIVAAPLAWLVSRSVTRPLGRVASAAAAVPSGSAIELPLEGPAEVRALTDSFNAMLGELEATRRREAELLANLRHDLRTPLTVIAGYATALRDGTATGEEATIAAGAIEQEAGRLAQLVEALAAVERIRSGADGLRLERLDARAVAAAAVSRFAARAAADGTSLGLLGPAPGPTADLALLADRVGLDRLLGNLVENGLAAAAGGTVSLEVAADRLPNGAEAIRIDVLDDGPGFPPDTTARAFDRFWRGDPSRTGSGSGLGLAIVRELAVAHGGTVHAANLEGRGARVGVTLPAAPS
ncbi:MAG TPA: HAMP domain-containing sensor histidine kinase [Candidatus Deferrimicrobiaceae bacterium]|nr:HAMP domain-containing sensor histidine kinase [Candidatus Deferrimicrobiaceae bacterium]